ncbi:unnamed protein product [Gongylonema pulchrum]|uniref:DUF115 domain-containing protein n=1 Tax=Gongylonema pulchrum TaxID=637853 RepID=A0A183E0N9_9BILA|nr:unnamed protein product [Gongylonema pulchrum]
MEPFISLLHESGVFPTTDLKKLSNFSASFLQKIVQNKASHLVETYSDFLDLLSAYNTLLCHGLTAFAYYLQALAARNTTISALIESSAILKEAYFLPTISRPTDLKYHKLDALIALLKKTRSRYGKQQQKTISEQSLRDNVCNVIIMPCGTESTALNIECVDLLICLDEGFVFSAPNFKNIYSFATAEGVVDCVQEECIKGAQLCNDVLYMLPANPVPEIIEFWAEKNDKKSV